MSKKKILVVFGTRPEAIKMAPLIMGLQSCVEFDTKICVTAQHREMLDQVLELFGMKQNYDLNIMKPDQDLFDVTASVLLGMKQVLDDFAPDLVLVHGDTTTTSTVALAAFYKQISIGHIEAGLRTGDIYNPWPEEANRKITSVLATYHFAPTESSKFNLVTENNNKDSILVTGNTVIDSLLSIRSKIQEDKSFRAGIVSDILKNGYNVGRKNRFILVTAHRRENFGEGIINICEALKSVAISNPSLDVVYPVHLNPNIKKPVYDILSGIENIFLINPLGYEQFVYMMNESYCIVTDSGGVQEEAPSLGKPVLVMRDTTERPEAVAAGTVKLIGTSRLSIINGVTSLLNDKGEYENMSKAHNPYGDGFASKRIIDFFKNVYKK